MTLEELELGVEQRGLTIVERHLPEGMWGGYSHKTRRIYLHPDLTAAQRRVTLAHELYHARRGDDGHQEPRVERSINRRVILDLLARDEYARAERLHGCDVVAMAQELDLPVWVIEGYQDHLRQSGGR